MTDDRELLELAAKAAGYVIESMRSNVGAWCYPVGEQPNEDGDHPGLFGWNPLADDGDALRLAVKLGLLVDAHGLHVRVGLPYGLGLAAEPKNSDPYAATRRAIVRAAAEIGRTMPSP